MKYPEKTIDKPVTGDQARRVREAISKGQSVTNDAGRATVERILERRRTSIQNEQDGKREVRRS